MKRIPTLDGWRGIAIALVLFDHVQAAFLGRYLWPWTWTGQHGVTIFFVLSGFLITSKLLEGPIDLKRFYIRRFFRLMPVAWAYLAVMWIIENRAGQHWISLGEIASCVFFCRNYYGPGQTLIAGHYWSLSIEEQFYMIWPCLLLLAGTRKAKWIAIAGMVLCASYRFIYWNRYDSNWPSFQTEVRADALLAGCLLALLLAMPRFRLKAVQWSKVLALPAFVALSVSFVNSHWLPPLYECLAIAGLIAASVLHPQTIFSRFLSFPPMAWLGTISYSVYVWQQFFFQNRGETSTTIVSMCLMPLFALGSYYLLERPATRLAHRITSAPIAEKLI